MIRLNVFNRLKIAVFLCVMELFSLIVLDHVPYDDTYYLVCGAFNFIIILVLPFICKRVLVIDFQLINLLTLIVQGFGFLFYWCELPTSIYNYSIYALNAIQILRLLVVRKDDVDDINKNNYWITFILNTYFNWFKVLPQKVKL